MADTFSVAISIDFGTTYSGYAYCFVAHTKQGDIYKNTDWNTLVGQKSPYVKTPTYLLYEGNKFDSWGYKAKKRLVELRQQGSASNYHFIEKFKTELFHRHKVDENGEPYLEDDGEKFSIVDLVADYLREISSMALQDVKNNSGSINETQIRWCLTVPAIWNDAAKQLMEQAAKKAGILKEGDWDAERFMFALEPEAAAVYCLYVADKELGIVEDRTTMMIADCGGGTADFTVHEIIREGREKGLREVVPGSGAVEGHGGKDVDKNFLNYFAKVLSSGAIDMFESQYPEAYLQMMDDWETFKYGFDPDDYERGNFRLPGELRDILQKHYPKVLEELANKQNGNSFNVSLTRKVMENEIFGPVVNNILERIKEVFNRIGGKCDYLYLVGGFATSRFLQQRIKKEFGNHVKKKVLIPGEPGKSIMIGAASFARNPDIILARRARLTYGVAVSTTSQEVILLFSEFAGEDLPSEIRSALEETKGARNDTPLLSRARKKSQEMGNANFTPLLKRHLGFDHERDEPEMNGVFDSFITAGESVFKNHEVSKLFQVSRAHQQEADILIFASDKKEVLFVDEPEVDQIANLNLKMPSTRGGLNRGVEVTMYFGDTKLKVKARDCTEGSDSEVETELDFLITHAMN
jgi:hypothetical protein